MAQLTQSSEHLMASETAAPDQRDQRLRRETEEVAKPLARARRHWRWTLALVAAAIGLLAHLLTWYDRDADPATWRLLLDPTAQSEAAGLEALWMQSSPRQGLSLLLVALALLGGRLALRLWRDADIDRHIRTLLVGLIVLWLAAPLVWQVQWHRWERLATQSPVALAVPKATTASPRLAPMASMVPTASMAPAARTEPRTAQRVSAEADLLHSLRRSSDLIVKAWLVIGVGLVVAVVMVRNP